MTPRDRVEKLIADGRVDAAEGARLLAALDRGKSLARFDPFVRFGGGMAAAIGVALAALSVAIARLGIRFDGALDLHIVAAHPPTLRVALLDQAVAFVLPAVVFWLYARVQTAHVRVVDFLGMVGLARLPVVLGALPIFWLAPPVVDPMKLHLSPALLAVSFVSFVVVAAHVTLLFFGFRNASGLQGKALGIGFTAVLIATEIASKVALSFAH